MALHFTDVTLRDGLQAEKAIVPTEKKEQLFYKLLPCGMDRLELTSFVHPKWIPQLADSQALCESVFAKKEAYSTEIMAFVPNERGLEGLLKYPIEWASCFIAASDTFNQKNINRSQKETLPLLKSLVEKAHQENRKIRIYVSTVFGCPYEGELKQSAVMDLLKAVTDLGPDEIALSDTIGVAKPQAFQELLGNFLKFYPADKTALHLHDTYGTALACVHFGYQMGVRRFDGSMGGVGGCPYAKGASGNVALDELAYSLNDVEKKLDFSAVEQALDYIGKDLGLALYSRLVDIKKRGGQWYGIST